jgi:ferric-dicitrate binding protein FerR (iron transport regulator)
MSDTNDRTEMSDQARDEAALAQLLRLAGPREDVPPDAAARVYAEAHKAWRAGQPVAGESRVYAQVKREWWRNVQPRWRWILPLATATGAALAVVLALRPAPPPETTIVPVATIVRSVGGAQAEGTLLNVGDRIDTSSGQGLALRLTNANSLRLDENTIIELVARNRVALERGRIYADTGDGIYKNAGLVVETAIGVITDVGTQFAVSVAGDGLDVAVREGRVDVAHDDQTIVTVAGERMALTQGEAPDFSKLTPHDEWWGWSTALAPAFDLENQSLLEFLRWVERETGRELVFEDEELRLSAMRTDLHGSVADFDPLEALQSVIATTRLRYRVEPDRVLILR